MQNKIILGLVGEIASGKGTAVKYLEDKYNASSYRFSTPIRNVLDRLCLEINRKNMQTMSLILRKTFGHDLFAKIISHEAIHNKKKIIIVDGIRRPADIKYLKKMPDFKLIYVTADMKTRYQRIAIRKENTDDINKTFKQFVNDHKAEPELKITKIGQTADYEINNSSTKEELHQQIDKIITGINE